MVAPVDADVDPFRLVASGHEQSLVLGAGAADRGTSGCHDVIGAEPAVQFDGQFRPVPACRPIAVWRLVRGAVWLTWALLDLPAVGAHSRLSAAARGIGDDAGLAVDLYDRHLRTAAIRRNCQRGACRRPARRLPDRAAWWRAGTSATQLVLLQAGKLPLCIWRRHVVLS